MTKRDKGLELLVQLIEEAMDEELAEIEAMGEETDVEISEELHQKMLAFARELDKKDAEKRRKMIRTRIVRFAAVFCICFVAMGSLAVGTSDAFRERVFSLFHNDESGSVTLRSQAEYDLIGSWDDYWYPAWMPDGYYLLGADKEAGVMLYVSDEEEAEIRIMESVFNANQTFDTDTTDAISIEIQGWEGYLFVDVENESVDLIWMTDSRRLSIKQRNSADDAIVVKIANNLKYIPEN